MAQITGILRIYVNGRKLRTKPGAKFSPGGKVRSTEKSRVVLGYTEEIAEATLDCVIAHMGDTDVVELSSLFKQTLEIKTDTGQTYLVAKAFTTEPCELSSGGDMTLKMSGQPAELLKEFDLNPFDGFATKQPWEQTVFEEGMFKGVPFYYQEVNGTIGRRTVLTEYPGKDAKPRVEDMGPATGIFTMDLFVMGPNYDIDRDALRAAFNDPGQGELVHPYWGTMNVTVHGPVKVVETTRKGGMAVFTVTFVQDGEKLDLLEVRPTIDLVIDLSDLIIGIAEIEFDELFSLIAAIESTIAAAISAVQAVASVVNKIKGKIAAAMQFINDATAAINSVVDGVVGLINTPAALAGALTAMVRSVVTGVTSIGAAFEAAADFFDGEDSLPAEGSVIAARTRVTALMSAIADIALMPAALPALPTGTAQQQAIKARNQKALDRLMKANTIGVVSQVAVTLDYESYDQAQGMRGAITGLIDTLITDDDLSDDLYAPLCNLRAVLTEHFTTVASSLSELRDFTPVQTIPAIVLAYQIYGDSKREAEILARNPTLRDQTAVPGGVAVKVLVDE